MNERFRSVEIKLFLFLIPVISFLNYFLTYSNITFTLRTLMTFAIDTIQGYIAWLAVHRIIIYLDKALPYGENVLRRIVVQIWVTLLAGTSIIAVLTVIVHFLFKGGPFPLSFFYYDILIISVWFLVMNGAYISMDFYREWQASQNKRSEENKIRTGGLRVRSGKQDIMLEFEDIAGFSVEGEYILCYTMNGKTFVLDLSMDKLEKLVPDIWFFRLNRQILLHRQAIAGFQKAENGKLNIMVRSAAFSAPINVSRTRAPQFKQWFYPQ